MKSYHAAIIGMMEPHDHIAYLGSLSQECADHVADISDGIGFVEVPRELMVVSWVVGTTDRHYSHREHHYDSFTYASAVYADKQVDERFVSASFSMIVSGVELVLDSYGG